MKKSHAALAPSGRMIGLAAAAPVAEATGAAASAAADSPAAIDRGGGSRLRPRSFGALV